MLEHTGNRLQESLRIAPAAEKVRNVDRLLQGIIVKVTYKDKHPAKQTMVDIDLQGEYPNVNNVPLAVAKTNFGNGVEWTPDIGDNVLVQFINGNFWEPVVIGFLSKPDDGIGSNVQATTEDAPDGKRRYHFRCNETDVVVDKDGNRITTVAGYEGEEVVGYRTVKIGGDDTLEVTGNGTVIIHGNVTVHIYGTATVNVDGNTEVTTPNATIHSSGQITLDTPQTQCTGNLLVNGGISSSGTYGTTGGKIVTPGDIESTGGEVKDKVRTMSADRGIYNGHTHPENGTGGGTTSAPTQQQ